MYDGVLRRIGLGEGMIRKKERKGVKKMIMKQVMREEVEIYGGLSIECRNQKIARRWINLKRHTMRTIVMCTLAQRRSATVTKGVSIEILGGSNMMKRSATHLIQGGRKRRRYIQNLKEE